MDTKKLRQKVLDLAIHGKLVPQDPNDEPASVLLNRIRVEKERLVKEGKIKKSELKENPISEDEIPYEISEGWVWTKMSNVLDVRDGTHDTPKYVAKGYPLVTSKNLRNNQIDFSTALLISEEDYIAISQRSAVDNNDILYAMIGTIGNPVLVNEKRPFAIKNMALFKAIKNGLNMQFVYWFLYSQQDKMKKYATGGLQPFVSLGYLRNYYIPIPPAAEQNRIVKEITKLSSQIDIIEQSEAELEEAANKTWSKLLNLAIQGRLVPQDPNEEPASVLLEKIRAEKARLVKEKKIKADKNESRIFRAADGSWYEKVGKNDAVCIDDQIPFEIPENWSWERWGNISLSIQYGYNAPAVPSGDIKMVRISDIQENQVLWPTVPFCSIPKEDIDTYLLKPNDILFARTGGTVGKSFLVREVPEPSIYAGYLIRTRYSNSLNPEYMKFFMESELYWSQLRSGTTATAQPNCNGQTLSKMFFPLPPLPEQHRIVAKLEEILPKLKNIK